jgi:hypothetical protein
MFIEDIIVLTKYCRIFLVVLDIVIRRDKSISALLVAKCHGVEA